MARVVSLLAKQGFTGPEQAIEGTYGFARVMSDEANVSAITDGLGDSWEILTNAYKPYPCGVVLFPVIDGCLELRERHTLSSDRIAAVTVRGHPLLRIRTDRPDVTSSRAAKVSVQHSVAVAFVYGTVGLPQYADQCVGEPVVLELRRKVTVEEDANIPVETAVVIVQTTDGRRFECHVTQSRGTMASPMSDAELEAKFGSLAEYGAPMLDAERLIAAIWAVDDEQDVARTVKMMVR